MMARRFCLILVISLGVAISLFGCTGESSSAGSGSSDASGVTSVMVTNWTESPVEFWLFLGDTQQGITPIGTADPEESVGISFSGFSDGDLFAVRAIVGGEAELVGFFEAYSGASVSLDYGVPVVE